MAAEEFPPLPPKIKTKNLPSLKTKNKTSLTNLPIDKKQLDT